MKRITSFIAALLIGSPALAFDLTLMSDSQMAEMGAQSYAEIKKKTPASTNRKAKARVQCVSNALTKRVRGQWEVTLFKGDQANAFALPGGKIGVYEGLLKIATTQDELAAVIGHEIGHVKAEHANQRVSTSLLTSLGLRAIQGFTDFGKSELGMTALGLGAEFGVMRPFSRNHESEADKYGVKLMARSGFNPQASVDLWRKMKKAGGKSPPELLSTHPSHSSRIDELERLAPRYRGAYENARRNGIRPRC
ncbi:MAG: M48 family metallopeptidase [Salinisphaeraceae bacterium]|nr:M48 family metallopeptidase [Salinisphaeraceae bacterium]